MSCYSSMPTQSVIVWDLETVPDLPGFAAANDLVGKPDADIREALGNKFPKHIYHTIVCIGALVAHRESDHWAGVRRTCRLTHPSLRTVVLPGRLSSGLSCLRSVEATLTACSPPLHTRAQRPRAKRARNAEQEQQLDHRIVVIGARRGAHLRYPMAHNSSAFKIQNSKIVICSGPPLAVSQSRMSFG
jgi:hypothetical protein